MTYLEKISQFSKAAYQQGYDKVACTDAKDFVESFGKMTLDYVPAFVNAVSARDINRGLADEQHMEGQEYRDSMTPYEDACIRGRENARSALSRMNRFSAKLGLEPFADVDLQSNTAVEQVCGQIVLETAQKMCEPEKAFQKAVSDAKRQPSGEWDKLQGILEKQSKEAAEAGLGGKGIGD